MLPSESRVKCGTQCKKISLVRKESCVVASIPFEKGDLPAVKTLQDALRSSLDQDTGVSDAKGENMCPLQDEDMLVMLKRSDGRARRNMLQFRDDFIYGTAQELVASRILSRLVRFLSLGPSPRASGRVHFCCKTVCSRCYYGDVNT
jgi:hypothetical protein